jgi:hypothetical protein
MSDQANANGSAPKPQILIQYDPTDQSLQFACQGAIPLPLLVNYLEVMKTGFIHQQLAMAAQAQQQQKKVLMPGGAPIPNLRH